MAIGRLFYLKWITLYLLVIFSNCRIFGQSADSLKFDFNPRKENVLGSSADKQLNVYNFNGVLRHQLALKPMFLLSDLFYARTYIQSADPAIKENQSMNFRGGYQITDNASLGGMFIYNKFSDSRKTTLNFSSQQAAGAFGKYNFSEQIYTALSAGFESNKQLGQIDEGLRWEGEAAFRNYSLLESNVNAAITLRQEQISPRVNSLRRINGTIDKVFDDGITNMLSLAYESQRSDFYFPADEWVKNQYLAEYNIQSRKEESYSIANNLKQIPIFFRSLLGSLRISISQRQIQRSFRYTPANISASLAYPDKISETRFEGLAGLSWQTQSFLTGLSISLYQRDENHTVTNRTNFSEKEYQDRSDAEKEKDNSAKRINLNWHSTYSISRSDRLELTLSHSKLQYDTPSETNYDDRDELLSILRFDYQHDFSSFFRAYLRLEGTLNKLVYISGKKSSNNFTNDAIKLAAGGNYSGKYFTSVNYFSVSSNYTVYAFEDLVDNLRSYSYRQLYMSDSTSIKLSGTFSFATQTSFKFSEQGILAWSRFVTAPTRNTEEIFLHPQFITRLVDSEFGIGYRVFIVNTYSYKDRTRVLETVFKSMGPSAAVNFYLGSRVSVTFNGWLENIKNTASTGYTQSNFQFDLLYKM